MVVEGGMSVFLVGCAGGAISEVLHWWNLRQKSNFPKYASSPKYWILTISMILVGGLVAWLYFGQKAEGIVAAHVGLSAPLILQKMTVSVPDVKGARGFDPSSTSVRAFFTW
jgi:hypothetical protein